MLREGQRTLPAYSPSRLAGMGYMRVKLYTAQVGQSICSGDMKVFERELARTGEQTKSIMLLGNKENTEKRKKILDIFCIGRYTSFIVKGKDVPSYVRGTSLPFFI